MRTLYRLGLFLLGLCLSGNCGCVAQFPQHVNQVVSAQAASEQPDYSQALQVWTRSGTIYNQLDTELLITATYHAPEFLRAYVAAYARAYQLDEAREKDLWQERQDNLQEFHEFILAAYVPESDWNDFAHPRSTWKLYLETEREERLSPIEIRRIRKVSPLITSFYPYVKPWETIYKVRFATRSPGSDEPFLRSGDQSLLLVVTSPRGAVRLRWQLQTSGVVKSCPPE